jgi:putative ABC transport system permease protein
MPDWLSGLRVALRSVLRRKSVESELDEEIQYHLERQIAEGLKAGLTREDARYAALRSMGAIEKSKEECRDLRSGNFGADAARDLSYAARALSRSPGFTVMALGVMALGIGANTAVFSVVNAVLLKPLPYPEADRIVSLSTAVMTTGTRNPMVTIANFRDWRDQSASFEAMATYRGGEYPLTADGQAEYVRASIVDPEFFRVFGVAPVLGRTFAPEEMAPGRRSVLISHGYWQRRFGGDPNVLQRAVHFGAGSDTSPIVGVLPPGFQFPARTDLWLPETTRSTSRTSHSYFAVGRVEPGISIEQAQTELSAIAAGLEQQYPGSNKGRGIAMMRLQDELVGDLRLSLYLLWGVVGVVLLIACVNTATLLLARATAGSREIAVRAALGASRGRIVRQLLTESLLLGVLAGGAGILLAQWGTRWLMTVVPFDVVRSAGAPLDGGVLAFTLAASLATSLLFGLLPALQASKVDLIDTLKQAGARSVTGGRAARTFGLLVVSEIALAVLLLTGAGLLLKSLVALHNVDLGYRPENVLVMKATGRMSYRENNSFFREVIARIAALPGVVAVGATSNPPGDLSNSGDGSYFIDRIPATYDRNLQPQALYTVVTPGAFAAIGIPLKSGRDFSEGDTADRPLVAIVNEAIVRRSFGSENPIGRTIFCHFDRKEGMTIVGIVGDARQRDPALEPVPDCYMPYGQHQYNAGILHVVTRTAGDPAALAPAVRRVAAGISPDVPVSFKTMEEMVSRSNEDRRFPALLFAAFAALAVCLSMAGVYGVMAYSVEQRTREIGLRVALGASRSSVLRLILGQGLVLAVVGLTAGLAAAAAATRLLSTLLFEVQPIDAQVYLGVVVMLAAVTLIAGYLPARRATLVDPVEALKAE